MYVGYENCKFKVSCPVSRKSFYLAFVVRSLLLVERSSVDWLFEVALNKMTYGKRGKILLSSHFLGFHAIVSSSPDGASSQAMSCTVGMCWLATGKMAKTSMACACISSTCSGDTCTAFRTLATMVMLQMENGGRATMRGRASEGDDQVVMSGDPSKNEIISLAMASTVSRATNSPNWTHWVLLVS